MAGRGRPPEEPTRHDEAIRRSPAQYKARNYKVQADVAGFQRPDRIGRRRPDLIVSKGGKKIVIKFETPSTLGAHGDQHEELRRGAEAMGVEFKVRVPSRTGEGDGS